MEHDDDGEKLDWGNEDDEQAMGIDTAARDAADDAEDAVSIGGDVDDIQEFYAYQSRAQQQQPVTPPPPDVRPPPSEPQRPPPDERAKRRPTPERRDKDRDRDRDSSARRAAHPAPMKHALPPKPLAAPVTPAPLPHQPRPKPQRRPGPPPNDPDALPPPWEPRESRSGPGEFYFYNTKTHESTWACPSWDNVTEEDRHHRPPRRRELSHSPPRTRTDTAPAANPSSRPVPPLRSKEGDWLATARNDPERYYRPGDASGSNGFDQPRLRSRTRSASPNFRVQPVIARDDRPAQRSWNVEPRTVAPAPPEERRWVPRGQDPASSPVEPRVEPRRERPVSPVVAARHAPDRGDRRLPPYEQDPNAHEGAGAHWSAPTTRRGVKEYSRSTDSYHQHNNGQPLGPDTPEPPRYAPPPPRERREPSEYNGYSRPAAIQGQGTIPDAQARYRSMSPVQREVYQAREVPQRRYREAEPQPQPQPQENEYKRRRVDERTMDSAPARRVVDAEPTPSAAAEMSRKRAPLPPQDARFRQMTRPEPGAPTPPPPAPTMGMNPPPRAVAAAPPQPQTSYPPATRERPPPPHMAPHERAPTHERMPTHERVSTHERERMPPRERMPTHERAPPPHLTQDRAPPPHLTQERAPPPHLAHERAPPDAMDVDDYGGAGRGMIADRQPPQGPRRVNNAPPQGMGQQGMGMGVRQRTVSYNPEGRQPPPHMAGARQSWNGVPRREGEGASRREGEGMARREPDMGMSRREAEGSRRDGEVGPPENAPPNRYERDAGRVDERDAYHEPRYTNTKSEAARRAPPPPSGPAVKLSGTNSVPLNQKGWPVNRPWEAGPGGPPGGREHHAPPNGWTGPPAFNNQPVDSARAPQRALPPVARDAPRYPVDQGPPQPAYNSKTFPTRPPSPKRHEAVVSSPASQPTSERSRRRSRFDPEWKTDEASNGGDREQAAPSHSQREERRGISPPVSREPSVTTTSSYGERASQSHADEAPRKGPMEKPARVAAMPTLTDSRNAPPAHMEVPNDDHLYLRREEVHREAAERPLPQSWDRPLPPPVPVPAPNGDARRSRFSDPPQDEVRPPSNSNLVKIRRPPSKLESGGEEAGRPGLSRGGSLLSRMGIEEGAREEGKPSLLNRVDMEPGEDEPGPPPELAHGHGEGVNTGRVYRGGRRGGRGRGRGKRGPA